MKNNSFLLLVLILSLIANTLFIYSKVRTGSEFAGREQNLINQFAEKEFNERSAENHGISPFERFSDLNGDTIFLNSVLSDSKKLILVISDNSCGSCVENVLNTIQHTCAETDIESLIVLGLYENKRSFFLLSKKIPSRFFLIEEGSELRNFALKSPLLFTMDVDFKIRSAFFPLPQYSILTEKYLAQIMSEI